MANIPSRNHRSFREIWHRLEKYLKNIFLLVLSIYLYKNLQNYRDAQLVSFKFHVPFKNIPKTNQRNADTKYILFWTPWWHLVHWNMGAEILGKEYLKSIDCPVTNCIFSHNRSFLPQPTDYDALIFHMGNLWGFDDLPEFRREDQIYIVANEE